ncbi:peptidylprolyl isomerase [Pseudaestuariivita atlantica]|uniref:Parvulin-like PPIase n=1 Tax=Pseudaestuariivita atlantica TaxID=1317121 RepID=A0A0L1JKT2_9RHOB|nr:peptidylprolyl isomerase [Pseudaestuariivita atlantica]KNG92360.1 peptidylprolyl isomerase [Pseudaestuariivita atlantica]
MTQHRQFLAGLIMALAMVVGGAGMAAAQNAFSTAIRVNDGAITYFELEQRARMLALLRAPGDPQEVAREQLIDDRLRVQAARANGINPSRAEIEEGMAEFAGRANLTTKEFVKALASGGVEEETFRDFVEAGLAWRLLVRQRFGARAQPSEGEIDRALSNTGGSSNIRVLISELIMPAPPPQAQAVLQRAQRIAASGSEAEFSRAARRFSATPTRRSGGRLPWQNLSDLPPALQPIILGLAPGEITAPLQIPNAVALFQLRAIEEGAYNAPSYAAVEYATYYIPGGRSDAALAEARRVSRRVDRCDDLYGINKGQPDERLERTSLAPDKIPTDVAFELSKLDPGETSYALTRAEGQTLVFLMLCGRTTALPEVEAAPEVADGADAAPSAREEITLGLRNRRLTTFADSYLAQLRADARIRE